MTYCIKQKAWPDESSSKRWHWKVWIESNKDDLSMIDEVVYRLHWTFKNKKRRIRSRKTKFALKSNGWGEFMLHAELILVQGEPIRLEHWLKLADNAPLKPDKNQLAKSSKRQSVFLTYAASDSRYAEELKKLLFTRGIRAVTADDAIQPGVPVYDAIEDEIAQASATIALTPNSSTNWLNQEMALARKHNIPVYPVEIGQSLTNLPSSIEEHEVIRLKDALELPNFVDNYLKL